MKHLIIIGVAVLTMFSCSKEEPVRSSGNCTEALNIERYTLVDSAENQTLDSTSGILYWRSGHVEVVSNYGTHAYNYSTFGDSMIIQGLPGDNYYYWDRPYGITVILPVEPEHPQGTSYIVVASKR